VDDTPLRRFLMRGLGLYDRALVVYKSQAVETWLRGMGFAVFGAGSDAPPDSEPFPAVSLSVHGRGKNLQAWPVMLVLEPPSSGLVWEQLLGRIHRPGQTADLCVAEVLNPGVLGGGKGRLEKAREDAEYIEDTTGQKQKLGYANWDAVEMSATRGGSKKIP